MRKLKLIIIIGLFIALSNVLVLFYVTFFEGGFHKNYFYITHDGKFLFSTMPYKNTDVDYLEFNYDEFKKYRSEYDGKGLYRTFSINPLKYWHWYEYLFHKRYKYPYKKKPNNCIRDYEEINRIQKLNKKNRQKKDN